MQMWCIRFDIAWYAMLNKAQVRYQTTSTKISALIDDRIWDRMDKISMNQLLIMVTIEPAKYKLLYDGSVITD